MIMIMGGAFQGKTEYAKSDILISDNDILYGEKCSINEVFSARCIKNYHLLVKRMITENIDPIQFTEKLCKKNKDTVIIMDEIGCGIIPLEKSERIWRETVGRCGCIIAKNSHKVVRINCGIASVIKGE